MRWLALNVLLVLGLQVPPAEACPMGRPCTKYKNHRQSVDEPVYGYTHSLPGGLPRWSARRIAAFLSTGTWAPITTPEPGTEVAVPAPGVIVRKAQKIRFVDAAAAGSARVRAERIVILRRIEKQGRAILVEVDDRVFQLGPCVKRRKTTCLYPTDLALTPIDPPAPPPSPSDPTAPTNPTFAEPPPSAPR